MSVIVVGGGWSGLAAAVALCRAGRQVHLLEAAPQLGGRARSVDWNGLAIDNGQHLMIGGYTHMLTMLRELGGDENSLFRRLPLSLTIHDSVHPPLTLDGRGRLPWPLSLVWSLWHDNGWPVLRQLARVLHACRRMRAAQDQPVADWLRHCRQSPRLIRQLWEPLCLAMLNTPIDEASAHVFATVLQDVFGRRDHCDLLIPRLPLGEVFPRLAADYIRAQGGRISLKTRVSGLEFDGGRVSGVRSQGRHLAAEQVILAVDAQQQARLAAPRVSLPALTCHPIATVYLQYPPHTRLAAPIIGMSGGLSQWLFDRADHQPGLLAVVISGPGAHQALTREQLIRRVEAEIHQHFSQVPSRADRAMVIREKRATFVCDTGVNTRRPACRTGVRDLWLAGDHVCNRYPATLEGALINGSECARQLLQST